MSELTSIIEESFGQYAGAVLQSRALVDVRDCLKPSARQIFYSMLLHKLTSGNAYKKTANAVGLSMADFYIHGDSSATGIIMHAGQSFSMRYPLVDVKGNPGTQIKSGDWAAPRYTESRLSKITDLLFADIDKETIEEWRDNYDDTKQFPSVLPTKGFYNIVNGTMGIGIGLASSIPQFNIRDVNKALIHLIQNPDCDFEDIYCAPDFATGAFLLNENEVKESLKTGNGSACRLRSKVEYDSKDRCFIVTEIPFGVYTSTICGELDAILEDSEKNPGIEKYNDLTGKTPLLKIYLAKRANPDRVLKYLFKNTSLQSWYSINMTMLDQGRFPKVFGWKEALQAHIDHEKEVYRRGFNFDLHKIENRIHIIDGLLICLANIDEVVHTIKQSASTAAAMTALKEKFILDDVQAKAVLDMKLSRLAHLEVQKLEKEHDELTEKANAIHAILSDEQLFNAELIRGWEEVAQKFGDDRRTKILYLEEDGNEPVEIKSLQISLTNLNNVFVTETSSLYIQKRGGVGNKIKLAEGEYVVSSKAFESIDDILFFTAGGVVHSYSGGAIPIDEKIPLVSILSIEDDESICAMTAKTKEPMEQYLLFVTKKGMLKKSSLDEYVTNRKTGLKAITLDEGDSIVEVLFINEEKIGILSAGGNYLMINTDDIRPIGRIAKGVRGMKLNDDDEVIAAHVLPERTQFIASISGSGLFKKTPASEFAVQGRNTKGAKLQKLNESDWMADFTPLCFENEVLIASTRSCIRLSVQDIPNYSKGALGNKAIKLGVKDNVVKILKC